MGSRANDERPRFRGLSQLKCRIRYGDRSMPLVDPVTPFVEKA